MQKMHIGSLSQEDPLVKGIATHSSMPAWRIPWTEELGGPQSIVLQKSWTRLKQLHTHTFHSTYIYINVWCVYIHICVYICTHHIFFIHSSSGGHLGYFHISAILNNAVMNIGVLVFFQISVFVFFGCTPRSGILHHTAVLFLVF